MSGGAIQGIKEGDTFTVYRRGQTVTNPQTNVPIELPGKSIGKLKVQSVIAGDVNSSFTPLIVICAGGPCIGPPFLSVQQQIR